MKKPALLFMTILILFSTIACFCCNAISNQSISALSGCKNAAVESNSFGAFAYGSSGKNVYATRLLPSYKSYSVTLSGNAKSLCMDNKFLCAVYTSNGTVCIMCLDTDSGNYNTYNLGKLSLFSQSIFSVSGDRVFFLSTGRAYTSATSYDFSGRLIQNYSFSQNCIDLFTNSGNSYVRMQDGSVYRLDNNAEYCLTLSQDCEIYNAGAGWIADCDGAIYSLSDGKKAEVVIKNADYICTDSEKIYYTSGYNAYCRTFASSQIRHCDADEKFEYITVFNGKTAVVNSDFTGFTVAAESEYESFSLDAPSTSGSTENPSVFIQNNESTDLGFIISKSERIIYNINPGTTVSELKRAFDNTAVITTSSDSSVTSGKIKTGYRLVNDGKAYALAVRGDLTGEGNVNSRDVTLMMNYFIHSAELSGEYIKAADYNADGNIDNRDLVLISRNTN